MDLIDLGFKYLSKFLPKGIKRNILEEYHLLPFGNISYSQEGEDLIISRVFEKKNAGFYVDIGAHHPIRFSNTYKFYLEGWNGLNIDASPGSMGLFLKLRNRDINIETAVSDKKQKLNYYIFNEPAVNTFSDEIAMQISKIPGYFIKTITPMFTETINDILDKHIPLSQEIDFLTIDIEGLDFKVIKSLDFNKYKPKLILFEAKDFELDIQNDVYDFLLKHQYHFYAKTINTVFFKNKSF